MNKLRIVGYLNTLRLNEIGFDWECEGYHEIRIGPFDLQTELVPAPTFALAFKWFRVVKGLICFINYISIYDEDSCAYYYYVISKKDSGSIILDCCNSEAIDTYEKVEDLLLDRLIKEVNGIS